MSKALQWVIGIGVVLVVAALVFSAVAPLFLHRLAASGVPVFGVPFTRMEPRFPFIPGFGRPGWFGGRMPFFGFLGLGGCIWPLLLAGLIFLAILLISRRPAAPPIPAMAPLVPGTPGP